MGTADRDVRLRRDATARDIVKVSRTPSPSGRTWGHGPTKVIEMAPPLSLTCVENDTLSEAHFSRAAGSLTTHHAGTAHSCVACDTAWPCAKALAAAFILDLR